MSDEVRHILRRSALVVLPVLLVAGLAFAWMQQQREAREIVLVTDGMAFRFRGDPTPNPVIEAAPGERLRLVLINRERGFEHDLVLPDLRAATPLLPGDGGRAELLVNAPTELGDYEYLCSLHAAMMRGTLRVR